MYLIPANSLIAQYNDGNVSTGSSCLAIVNSCSWAQLRLLQLAPQGHCCSSAFYNSSREPTTNHTKMQSRVLLLGALVAVAVFASLTEARHVKIKLTPTKHNRSSSQNHSAHLKQDELKFAKDVDSLATDFKLIKEKLQAQLDEVSVC